MKKKHNKENNLLGFSEQARGHYKKNLTWVKNHDEEVDETSQNLLRGGRSKVFGTQGNVTEQSGTSIFDPVLCEIIYSWFCVNGGTILDPFAGGSVRGIVAEKLGFKYIGIDLRQEQITANEIQAKRIGVSPRWICGNSLNVESFDVGKVDLIFSCPPYFDLEKYSDDENDLSAKKTYEEFLQDYEAIILKSISLLKENRFCCFVVGDIRDKQGYYRGFVSDTIEAFEKCGAKFYNEIILVTAVGSLPIRVGRQFQMNRKVGKTHQNVLVFYKGDVKEIRKNYDIKINVDFENLQS